MKIFYMGLEPYEGRYTLQLQDWTERAFKKAGVEYVLVPGTTIDDSKAIVTGQVLDAHGRSYFGMSQMMNLVKMLKAGEITSKDIIFFDNNGTILKFDEKSNLIWKKNYYSKSEKKSKPIL